MVSRPGGLQDAETSPTQDQRPRHGTLQVSRLQEQEAHAARQQVTRKPQKKQSKLSAKTLVLRPFVGVFPSVASAVLGGATALALSRCRWHIACAMKSMKRLVPIDKRRATQRRQLAAVSWYSQSIYPLRVEHDRRTTWGHLWGAWAQERPGTWGRCDKLLPARLDALLIAHPMGVAGSERARGLPRAAGTASQAQTPGPASQSRGTSATSQGPSSGSGSV
jgi:hypothetical protein